MILAYYNKWVPLEKVRTDCGVSRDGSNAANVAKAARSYGLTAQGKRFSPARIREAATFPCIIWWNANHYVVLDGFKDGKAYLNDPASGRRTVTDEEFDRSYCMLCILFSPGPDFVPDGKREGIWPFLAERIRDNKTELTVILLTAVFAALAGVVIPAFSRVYSDNILSGTSPQWLTGFLILFGIVILYQLAAQVFHIVKIMQVSGKIAVTTNTSFLWHVLRMPMEFFSQRTAGDLSRRQSENDQVASILVSQLTPTAIQAVLLIFYLVVMLRLSVKLTLIGLLTVALNLLVVRYVSERLLETSRVQLRDEGKAASALVSGIDMIETIKAAGAENGYFERWSGYQASANLSKVRTAGINEFLSPLPGLLQQVSNVIVLSMGAALIINGHMTAGIFLAFQSLMAAFLNPVNRLLGAGQSIRQMRSFMERISDVMKYPCQPGLEELEKEEEQLTKEALENGLQKLSGELDLSHVTFGYSKLAPPLIRDFSLHVPAGGRIALVGGSGSGKSTIAKLISGLYDPWEGRITYDGKERREIPRPVFTGSLSVVDQDVVLFADTIENNIKMWDASVSNADMIRAARDAGIHDDIIQRKGGYGSTLEEGGSDLSGGQRQRIEIARVLAGNPSVVILDEATSALDAQTEYEVSEAIRARGITCIIVAHRLSTIRDCDEILVLKAGEVAERGTHSELMAAGGYYRQLVTSA
jgi:NHLM bacteriocin system ABC transporter peptidase/ATP-binding protein